MTKDMFIKIVGNKLGNTWFDSYDKVCQKYAINTPKREAAFLANLLHETAGLTVFIENLNYSKEGLLKVFPKYFDVNQATEYARKPQKIASRVYANRMGNGIEALGDGWKYRGRGGFQVTGKDNYKLLSKSVGVDFVANPDDLLKNDYIMLSAGWFWNANNLNRLADVGNIGSVNKRINGGLNGSAERTKKYNEILSLIH